jgi:hypothetical protein
MPFQLDKVAETPSTRRYESVVEEDEEDDELGELMVMTDEEDEAGEVGVGSWGGVPETPAR